MCDGFLPAAFVVRWDLPLRKLSCLFRCPLSPYSAHQIYEPRFCGCGGASDKLGFPWPPFNPQAPGQFEEFSCVKNEVTSSLVAIQQKISACVWNCMYHRISPVVDAVCFSDWLFPTSWPSCVAQITLGAAGVSRGSSWCKSSCRNTAFKLTVTSIRMWGFFCLSSDYLAINLFLFSLQSCLIKLYQTLSLFPCLSVLICLSMVFFKKTS